MELFPWAYSAAPRQTSKVAKSISYMYVIFGLSFPIPLYCIDLEDLDLGNHGAHSAKQNYVYTNPDKGTTLRKGDKVFCLSTKPIQSFRNPLVVRAIFTNRSAHLHSFSQRFL